MLCGNILTGSSDMAAQPLRYPAISSSAYSHLNLKAHTSYTMSLCQTCKDVFQGSCSVERLPHHTSFHGLLQSAIEYCYICRVIWQAVSSVPPEQVEASMVIAMNAKKGTIEHVIDCEVNLGESLEWWDCGIEFCLNHPCTGRKMKYFYRCTPILNGKHPFCRNSCTGPKSQTSHYWFRRPTI